MKKLLLMMLLSFSIFANWKVQGNEAYVTNGKNKFIYHVEGDSALSSFKLKIPANKEVLEVLEANKKNIGLFIAENKYSDNFIGIEGIKDYEYMSGVYDLVYWSITEEGIEGTLLESSPFFKELDKILKKSSSVIMIVDVYDPESDNAETFFEITFSSIGYTKAKEIVNKK